MYMETNHQNCPNCGHSFTKQELFKKSSMLCPVCHKQIVKHFTFIPIIILTVADYLIVRAFHQSPASIMFLVVGCILALLCRGLLLCCYPMLEKIKIVYLKEK